MKIIFIAIILVCAAMPHRSGECHEPGRHYMVGGHVCKYEGRKRGNCNSEFVHGFALGHDYYHALLVHGKKYHFGYGRPAVHFTNRYKKENGDVVRVDYFWDLLWRRDPKGVEGDDWEEMNIYRNSIQLFLYGDTGWNRGSYHCVSSSVPINGDGQYAMILKSLEQKIVTESARKRRAFNVRLSGVLVLKDEDFYSIHRKLDWATEIVINYRIYTSRQGKTRMEVNGVPDFDVQKVHGERFMFSFCNSDCTNGPRWYENYGGYLSAIEVIRYS